MTFEHGHNKELHAALERHAAHLRDADHSVLAILELLHHPDDAVAAPDALRDLRSVIRRHWNRVSNELWDQQVAGAFDNDVQPLFPDQMQPCVEQT